MLCDWQPILGLTEKEEEEEVRLAVIWTRIRGEIEERWFQIRYCFFLAREDLAQRRMNVRSLVARMSGWTDVCFITFEVYLEAGHAISRIPKGISECQESAYDTYIVR